MIAVNYGTLKNDLKKYCDKASDSFETVIVTRKAERNVVIMGLDQYNELLRRAKRAEYLEMIDKSMEQIAQGKVVVKSMEELEAMADG